MGRMKTGRMRQEQKRTGQLIEIADQAHGADAEKLETLDRSLHRLIDEALASAGNAGAESTIALAINHARYSITARRAVLNSQRGQSPAEPSVAT